MLAFSVIEALRRGRGASFLALCASFVVLQCGQEEFDLLTAGQTEGEPAATGGAGGPYAPPPAGSGGAAASGGRSSVPPPPPCIPGLTCPQCVNDDGCILNPAGPFCERERWRCVECRGFGFENMGCRKGFVCDRSVCRLPCLNFECQPAWVCDVDRNLCVECLADADCVASDRDGAVCSEGRCVQCADSDDCGDQGPCALNACVGTK
jgi:hypothetical protein